MLPFSEKEAKQYLLETGGPWQMVTGTQLFASYKFKDFSEAMRFVTQVAEIAEEQGHHPDISISYNRVELTLSTHAIEGLSKNDFILASRINLILTK